MPRQTSASTVSIDGYAQLRRDLLKLSADTDAMLKALNVKVADEIIDHARARAAAVGRQQMRAAKYLKAYRSARAGGVNLRQTNAVPFAMGAEFGARRPQFKPWRGAGADAGYIHWPAIPDTNLMHHYSDGLADVVEALANG